MKNLFQLNRFFKKYRSKLLLGILFVSLSNFFRILQPQAIRNALDSIVEYTKQSPAVRNPEVLTDALMKFGLLVLAYAVLMGIFMYFMRQTIIVMSRLIEYDIRKDIFRHYLSLDRHFFKSNKTGDLMSRITEDVNKVRMYLGPALLYGINLVSLFIVVIVTMFKVNFWLSIYTLLPLPILSLIIYWVSNTINRRSERIQIQLAKLTNIAQESMSGIRIIKSYSMESYWANTFKTQAQQYRNLNLDLAKVDAMFFPSMLLLIGLSTLITIYIGGINVANGSVSAGNIAEFVIYVNMLTWPVSAIGWCASIVQQAEASQKRINEFLKTESTLKDGNQILKDCKGEIQFNQVNFTYPESGTHAIKDFSFKIKPGEKIAIVGKTASGKSTLSELLLRMYDPDSGEIIIDGNPIQNLTIHSLRNSISYVPQDIFLFSDTIKNNILFGTNLTHSDRLDKAIGASMLIDEVKQMPEGIETIIGERGVSLSGGQKQRLALARALVEERQIIILDDCLSAVDAHTEESILNEMQITLSSKTVILITQRLRQTQQVDKILVFDDGRMIEQGTFDQLMEQGGLFSRLYLIESGSEERV